MTTGISPYETPDVGDADDSGPGSPIEFTLILSRRSVNIGIGTTVQNAEVFNGEIPGPTIRLTRGQTVCVRLINDLPHPSGIHWHGIELANYADGTEVTQDGAPGGDPAIQRLGNGVPAGGTFLYKFTVTRAGLFWYHPHHHNSLNRLYRGAYGLIVVTDPLEPSIVSDNVVDRVLPRVEDTLEVVLSDTFVSQPPNAGPMYADPSVVIAPLTADDAAEWLCNSDLPLGGTPVTAQTGPTPAQMVAITEEDGSAHTWTVGEIPNVTRAITPGVVNNVEGNIVLTNGMTVGGRYGRPDLPRALMPGGQLPRDVMSGQGVRLQIVNCATLRYFRLRVTYAGPGGVGVQVPIVRIGGEGGLLDRALLEGGPIGTIPNPEYDSGELLLPPATRADVVIAIPAGLAPGTVLTMWTRDFKRIGNTPRRFWSQLPTVAVMHFNVTGPKPGTAYTIAGGNINDTPPTGAPLRAPAGMTPVDDLKGLATTALLAGPAAPPGTPTAPPAPPRPALFVNDEIKVTVSGTPAFDEVAVGLMPSPPEASFTTIPHIGSSRYATPGSVLVLKVSNTGRAHHPFHLHGFSFQPIRLDPYAAAVPLPTGSYVWTYNELRDTIDIPPNRTLTFRVRLDPRPLADGNTPGGALGRWLFHCHIFFHHEHGMISELVVTTSDGREKPTIKVGGSWEYTALPGTATRDGTYHHPDGLAVTSITARLADGVTDRGNITRTGTSSGTWHWDYPAAGPERTEYIYVTATDVDGRKDQAVFRLQVGQSATTAWDVGDPHIHTVDGKRYDFQSAGEFILLRDREGMEIQTRQTPVETPPPITDSYSGLTACVSLNTAVAARVGRHRVSYQAIQDRFRFFLDGKPAQLTTDGTNLEGHRVSAFDVAGNAGLRIDYANGTVVTASPLFWQSYDIWYLDINVSHTSGTEGIMGRIPKATWLPMLPSGASVGPRPESLYDRYVALYQTFADAWRVTDETSMFWYAPGTSTETFTDRDWPHPPATPALAELELAHHRRPEPARCKVKPGFAEPRKPIRERIPIEKAKQICENVHGVLFEDCVFDVASTGDPSFARGYEVIHKLEHRMTHVHIRANKPQTRVGEPVVITAIVAPLGGPSSTPTGTVTFHIDGFPGPTRVLDAHGRASFSTSKLAIGKHAIRAAYTPDAKYFASSSPNLLHPVVVATGDGVGAGTGPCAAHGRTCCPDWLCIVLWNASKMIHECVDRLLPCECGGGHTRADHPQDHSTHDDSTNDQPDPEKGGGHGHGH